jgi:enoyl-CoA hydratase
MSDDVSVRVDNGVGRITLNRPAALHSLTMEMFQSIMDAVTCWSSDPSVFAVLVDHAEGTRGFCSGGDIRMFLEAGSSDPTESRNLFTAEYALNVAISRFPKPYIGVQDGITMGGGAGITIHGSHRIATENTVFAMPETGIGLFPDIGAGFFLPRLEGELGTWLGLTGDRIKGSDVVTIGLATHYVPSAETAELKSRILNAKLSRNETETIDSLIDEFSAPLTLPTYRQHLDSINRCYGHDQVEEIVAALAQEATDWAMDQEATLRSKCPTSLKLALRLIREGANCRSVAEEMRTEYRIVWRRVNDCDLAEGVRSIVVDKDRCPQWQPPSLEDIGDEMIDEYFAPLGEKELPISF